MLLFFDLPLTLKIISLRGGKNKNLDFFFGNLISLFFRVESQLVIDQTKYICNGYENHISKRRKLPNIAS